LVALSLVAAVQAQESAPEPGPFKASASLEAGVDSAQRRYVRPRLRFDFPTRTARVFTDLDFYHRTNGDLEGEVDFWLGAGLSRPLSSRSEIEALLRHFCRHKTARDYPDVLDINEVLVRYWHDAGGLRLGLGGGTYLGTSGGHNGLMVLSLSWPRIFQSELSAAAEIKWVDLKGVLYDLELAVGLDTSVDLVARFTKHYVYPATTYFGFRFSSAGAAERSIDQFRFRSVLLPDDDTRKVAAAVGFGLHFFKTSRSRLILELDGDIPIERGRAFLGPFRPEEVRYRTDIIYERRVAPDLYAFGYGRYDLHLPVDTAQRFDSSWGLGLGLKNQSYFKKLDRSFRYIVFAGRSYSHGHDAGLAVGLNTVGKAVDIGGDFRMELRPGEFHALGELFAEAGGKARARPFLGIEWTQAQTEEKSFTRFLIGLELTAWH
jgi:hypothetical protein